MNTYSGVNKVIKIVCKVTSIRLFTVVGLAISPFFSVCPMDVQVTDELEIIRMQVVVAKAHLHLGEMYLKGAGCKQDYEKARECFLIAANQDFNKSVKAWSNI